jgi:cytochrome c oxidase subunit 2
MRLRRTDGVRATAARALDFSAVPAFAVLPATTPQESIVSISVLVIAVCFVIFLIVGGLLAYGLVRYRRRDPKDTDEPPQVYGSREIELAWTVIPILLVIVFFLATARTLSTIQDAKPTPTSVHAVVVGHQWWWEIRYPELGVVTANELHVPASDSEVRRPTFLSLESADVAHSFWVPELGGKTDLIPGRVNEMWFETPEPGVYLGNCAEFCGVQHAHMLIRVVVESKADFDRWVASQRENAVDAPEAAAGRALFLATSCVNCHTVTGTTATGTFGPDLTHLMNRQTIASGTMTNSVENLRAWMRDPQVLKSGCLMPNMQLDNGQLDEIVAYLATLR